MCKIKPCATIFQMTHGNVGYRKLELTIALINMIGNKTIIHSINITPPLVDIKQNTFNFFIPAGFTICAIIRTNKVIIAIFW